MCVFAPVLLIRLMLYFAVLCFLVYALSGCSLQNWSFKPYGSIKTDEITKSKKIEKLEIEEIRGQFEYKF